MKSDSGKKLGRNFYTRDLLLVAKELLGKILVKRDKNKILSGKIVEVEAYDGEIDEAAHTFIGITKRNQVMFGEGGFLYVYFTYGVHFCFNIVTGVKNKGTAALIRGIEPIDGIEQMFENRFGAKNFSKDFIESKKKYTLTNGPGKVCQAFKINRSHYGIDLTANEIYLTRMPKLKDEEIVAAKRIGITKSAHLPWRFYIKDNPYVSKK